WADEFLKAVDERFDEWTSDNHQRSHVVITLRLLNEPVPQVDRVISITLKDQLADGRWSAKSWNPAVPQTAFGIGTLKILDKKGLPEVNEAIERGVAFIEKCFKTFDWKGRECGGYANEPEDLMSDPLATSIAILAELNPDQMEKWMRF
ncbi:MAG: hypothetical protein Q7K45_02365, partial [Nanoarchaeota archaeon]|nr:hypothetical protein [Nanoarchaeota archaeon]